jgi:hypothetical protein
MTSDEASSAKYNCVFRYRHPSAPDIALHLPATTDVTLMEQTGLFRFALSL